MNFTDKEIAFLARVKNRISHDFHYYVTAGDLEGKMPIVCPFSRITRADFEPSDRGDDKKKWNEYTQSFVLNQIVLLGGMAYLPPSSNRKLDKKDEDDFIDFLISTSHFNL